RGRRQRAAVAGGDCPRPAGCPAVPRAHGLLAAAPAELCPFPGPRLPPPRRGGSRPAYQALPCAPRHDLAGPARRRPEPGRPHAVSALLPGHVRPRRQPARPERPTAVLAPADPPARPDRRPLRRGGDPQRQPARGEVTHETRIAIDRPDPGVEPLLVHA